MSKERLIYKYLVIGYAYDYYWYCYRQINKLDYALFEKSISFPKLLNRLYGYDITFLKRFIPSKSLWISLYLFYLRKMTKKLSKNSSDKICFLLLAGGLNMELLNYSLCKKIKSKYPNSKIVFFISDVSKTTREYIPMMKKSDLVITFDSSDAKRFDILYHVIPYSNLNSLNDSPLLYDLSFVGIAKERLDSLISLYLYLSYKGVNCHFIIVKVPQSKQILYPGIEYRDWVSYEDNLKILSSSKCILDYTKNSNSTGNTLRIGEGVMLNKRILTNNPNVVDNGIYDSRYMRIFSSFDDIDISFLKSSEPVLYEIKEKLYPNNLLSYIDNKLADQ